MRMLLAFAAAAALAVAQPLPVSAPEKEGLSSERLGRMHAAIEELVQSGKRAGAITLVARNGRIADWKTYGFRDAATKAPMQKDTICRIYSMSKPITSVAILILLEEGKLTLNDRLDKFAPEFADVQVLEGGTADAPKLVSPRRPITIKHLLTHTSGLIYGGEDRPAAKFYASAKVFEIPTLKEFVAAAAKLPLAAHPGQEWIYSISTDVLGYVVEAASGIPFEQFLQQRIFAPLKMKDTGFSVPAEKREQLARVHQVRDGKLSPMDIPFRSMPSGGGGLFSTISDYTRFAQMLLNGGQLDGARILSRKTVELMMANHLSGLARPTTGGNDSEGFGLGGSTRIDLAKSSALGSVGDFGWAGAASTWFRIDPKEKLVAVLFMQQMPMDAATQQKFSTLVYQSIVD